MRFFYTSLSKIPTALVSRGAVALLCLLAAVALISAPQPAFTTHEKAAYLTPAQVSFVRPGLVIKITSAEIASDGTIKVGFKLTDPRGLPLDRLGNVTPGAVSVSFIAAAIPKGETQYVAYTTRSATSPITNKTAIQASGESTGAFVQVGEGDYTYTFTAKAPSGIDRTVTHTIGAYGSRNLVEFDLGTQYDDAVFNFVPGGGAVTTTRDIIRTATCNRCHLDMGFHGGSRKTMELCVLCHTPQTIDPDTGNTMDLPVMAHKIHMGSGLPSVKAGKPHKIIGNAQSEHDFSDVNFPADARNCMACHEQGTAAQADKVFKPTRAACGACHDDVNFQTGANHLDLVQISDNSCATCHVKQGELDFDASILGGHMIPRMSKSLAGVVFTINSVSDAAPGKKITVDFSIKDKAGNPVLPSKLTRLNFRLAGPSTDYRVQISEDALKADGANGRYFWTFVNPIPADARGTFTLGVEGRTDVTLLPGTKQAILVRDSAQNKTMSFSVDGTRMQPRRAVVSNDKCNACHAALALHGDARNTVEQCVLCHNPTLTAGTGTAAVSVNFPVMIHRIHRGNALTRKYAIGTTVFNEVGFPGDLRNCATCHVNRSEQLPLQETLGPVADPNGPLKPLMPAAAACTGCHDSIAAASHAAANTNAVGESCSVCHGPNGEFSVDRVHAR